MQTNHAFSFYERAKSNQSHCIIDILKSEHRWPSRAMQRPIAKFVMGLHQSWRAIAGFTTAIVKPTIGIIIYEIAKNYYVIAIAFFTAFAYRAFRQGALRFGAIAYW